VTSIDYRGSSIVVTTNKAQYTTNNLLVGVPLGTLKANQIQFNPPLPLDKQQAINNIGFGIF
jgi:monoamine oxidase